MEAMPVCKTEDNDTHVFDVADVSIGASDEINANWILWRKLHSSQHISDKHARTEEGA